MEQTIEERAKAFAEKRNACDTCDGGIYCPCDKFTADYDMCFKIATEQDCIARVDERERCITIMQNFVCDICPETRKTLCIYECRAKSAGLPSLGFKCDYPVDIRKAMQK